jgi:Ca2+-binding RTX toxin-like protein
MVAVVTAPVSAAPTCDGKPATIVGGGLIEGTDGNDVIVGSNGEDLIFGHGGKDTICGRKGDDRIDGGGKRDRIFGGSGDDDIKGGPGHDDIFGFKGDDRIRGQDGNDFINGGAGTDDCAQGPGNGAVKRCEKADLKVKVNCPAVAAEGVLTCKIKVINKGPNASGYVLDPGDSESKGGNTVTCDNEQPDLGPRAADHDGYTFVSGAKLRPGAKRTVTFTTDCSIKSDPPVVWINAEVDAIAKDKNPSNNFAEDKVGFETDVVAVPSAR